MAQPAIIQAGLLELLFTRLQWLVDHDDVMELLIRNGTDCNQRDKDSRTPLHVASEAAHSAGVDLLIQRGVDCNKRNKLGRTPLHAASVAGHDEIVELLIKCGTDCNQSDTDG